MQPDRPSTVDAQQSSTEEWTCVTCGRSASNDYCSHCGEKRRYGHDFSLRHVFTEAMEGFFHLDSKVFLSLRTLVLHPGRLTSEFFLGRKKPYMTPLQLFFVCNLIFFVLQPLTGLEILAPPLRSHLTSSFYSGTAQRLVARRLAAQHISGAGQSAQFGDRFDQASHLHAKSLVILMVPMLALVLAVFFLRSHRFVAEHIIFSLHFYAWWLLWVLIVLVITAVVYLAGRAGGLRLSNSVIDILATGLEFGGFAVYLFIALRSFYQERAIIALAKAATVTLIGYYLLLVYRFMLFFTVLYST